MRAMMAKVCTMNVTAMMAVAERPSTRGQPSQEAAQSTNGDEVRNPAVEKGAELAEERFKPRLGEAHNLRLRRAHQRRGVLGRRELRFILGELLFELI